MTRKPIADVAAGRLTASQLAHNFSDVSPPLNKQAALIEANRCFYCYDAPCIKACPTGIDIPRFIKRIATEDQRGAATQILSANIFGGSCARVCPTEVLCEGDCVRNKEGDTPIQIGALQRYATNWVIRDNVKLFTRQAESGRRIAVIGAGPSGLACAHALACKGHQVDVFDAREKPGGLNEYGIAAYKIPDFAQREIEWLLSIGGIKLHFEQALGSQLSLSALRKEFDAVFLGLGLAAVNSLGIDGDTLDGVRNAVDFIAELRQSDDLTRIAVGRRVVVIGGGNTAIDAAVQSRRLGAESVTLVYRRGAESMSATPHEQAFAKDEGVNVILWARPHQILAEDGQLSAIEFEYTQVDEAGRLIGSGEFFSVPADTVLRAIGQAFDDADLRTNGEDSLQLENGRIKVDSGHQTSLRKVWAGGDCVGGKVDLTVQAVEDGKRAAASIHHALTGGER